MKKTLHVLKAQSTTKAEKVTFQGESYWKVPSVVFRPGVWNKIKYTAEVINRTASFWNRVPIPVNHPKKGDVFVVANTPEVFDTQVVGSFFDVECSDGVLKGNMFISDARLKAVSPVGHGKLTANQELDVSTGMLMDLREEKGKEGDREYTHVCEEMIADHVALLVDEKGACSLEDGCGTLLVNTDGQKEEIVIVEDELPLLVNGRMLTELQMDMRVALEAQYPGAYVYVADIDIDNGMVYFELESKATTSSGPVQVKVATFGRGYKTEGGKISFSDDVSEVKRVTSYNPVVNVKEGDMKHEELVNALITNEKTAYCEDDKEWLVKLTDCQLTKMQPIVETPAPVVNSEKTEEGTKVEGTVITAQQIAEMVTNAVKTAMGEQRRNPIIARLVANKDCPLGEDELRKLSDESISKLDREYGSPNILDWSLRGGPRTTVTNAEETAKSAPDMPGLLLAKAE